MFFKYFFLRTIILNPPISQPVASFGRGEFVAAAIVVVVVEEGTGVGGGLPMDFVFFKCGTRVQNCVCSAINALIIYPVVSHDVALPRDPLKVEAGGFVANIVVQEEA